MGGLYRKYVHADVCLSLTTSALLSPVQDSECYSTAYTCSSLMLLLISDFLFFLGQIASFYELIGNANQDKNYMKLVQDNLVTKNSAGVSCINFNQLSDKHVPGIKYQNDELMRKKSDEHYELMQKNCAEHFKLMRKMCAEHEHSLQRQRFLNLTHAQSMQDIASADKNEQHQFQI